MLCYYCWYDYFAHVNYNYENNDIDFGADVHWKASVVDAVGEPIPTSAVLMSTLKHIAGRCRGETLAFLKCKKYDPNPEKCLDKGSQVTRYVMSLCYKCITTNYLAMNF
ncbi:unnamed protein product [Lactuca virosa]|uniref:Uncharacterized protein n=1 Tax=Lactuca virosa TaxID=75947 RepID=A0AAU9NSH0_9ASTR|nr:unnamed protein product [Lactuca virosa]